jgi:DNA-binding Lrp family transcriptional regulator
MTDQTNPPGIWISISELARRRGISKVSAKERVDKLEEKGLVTTMRQGNKRLVELAAFDHATGSTGSVVKELAAETTKDRAAVASPAYRDAQTERAQYEARLKALDLAERMKTVLPVKGDHGIEAAAAAIGVSLVAQLEGMPRMAEEMATAVSKEGVNGARRVLKEFARKMRTDLADRLAAIAETGRQAEAAGSITVDLFDEGEPSSKETMQ